MENKIRRKERNRAADKSADERKTCRQIENSRFDVIVDRLKQCRRAHSDHDRADRIVEKKIDEFFFNSFLFTSVKEHQHRRKNTDGDHNSVHMNFPKYRIG